MMEEDIKNFHIQFAYEPKIQNLHALRRHKKCIVAGMGGSNLSPMLLKIWHPSWSVLSHRTYGLPTLEEDELRKHLVITNSHSGNTEETIDALHKALELHLDVAAVSGGGRLLEIAHEKKIPFIELPETDMQPRLSTVLHLKAMLALMNEHSVNKELSGLAHSFRASDFKEIGKELAESLSGKIPVIYASEKNKGLAYNWKIKFNETGKIPAFYNVFPELNHNEMNGFDAIPSTKELSEKTSFIFLNDANDHPRIIQRMKVCKKLYEERGFDVYEVKIRGSSIWHKIFGSLITADWTALYLSNSYGTEPNEVPMVEDFKKLIK